MLTLRFIKKTFLTGVCAVSALAMLLLVNQSFAETENKTGANPALTVRLTQLKPSKMLQNLSATGSVQAWQEAVISAEISGLRIAEVNVSVGDKVRKGEVLATLAAETVQASEAEAQAALNESEAILADAKANADRSRKLSDSGFVSDQQASQSNTSEQTAQARVEVQRARLQSAKLRVQQTRIVAADFGIISAANAASGSLSQSGAELFRLIRKGYLEWRAELSAEELAQVRKGMQAEIIATDGRTIKATVRAVAPLVNPQTRTGYALIRLPEESGVIAGSFVRGTLFINGGQRNVLSLPQSAVMQRGNKTYVLIVGQDNRVREREVTVGQRAGNIIEIKHGLSDKESVVESGGSFLTEGDLVQVVKG